MRRFNQEAASVPGVQVYVVSMDLPFAQKRWCGATGSDKIQALSDFKERSFGSAYGVFAPEKGLLVRAVFVVGKDDKLRHVEYVRADSWANRTTPPRWRQRVRRSESSAF